MTFKSLKNLTLYSKFLSYSITSYFSVVRLAKQWNLDYCTKLDYCRNPQRQFLPAVIEVLLITYSVTCNVLTKGQHVHNVLALNSLGPGI